MHKASYKFLRDGKSPVGFTSSNRSSTDALNVVHEWSNAPGRNHKIIEDEDDYLLAELSWDDEDLSAGGDLDDISSQKGVSATRKLVISCRVKVPAGKGLANHPYRVLRLWRNLR